ncbi:hypothetical protein CTAYLR_002280 [Chrysophaeum taylorii]|uniref:Non-specific serine/threonine protein kinase n=1 Tax=Chrysophaeum taylorii TaxID=2483200 RepID=A0AAD7UQD1_9STRA|nr:hypothetical protein CTAYLR_002280 [Chrysophaeum taylorii]
MDGPDDPYNREAILALLRSGNESERIAAAYQIRRLVARAGRELSGEMFCRFEEDLYNQLFRMVHATDVDEKLGGVSAVEALIGAPSAEPETKGIKFANVLSNALKQQCNVESRAASGLQHGGGSRVFVTKTAAALGRLAKRGPASSGDHVEFEVIRALEWLQHSGDSGTPRRLTACLVLRELAKHAPTLFYTKVRDFFDRIWPALVDGRSTDIRDAAASALGAALEIVSQRPTARHSHYYCSIYSHAHAALAPYIAKQSRSASEKPFADPPPLPPLHSEAASTLAARRDGRRGKQPSWWRRLLFGGDDNFLSAPPQLRRSPEQRFGAAAARSGPPPRRSGSDSAIKPKVRSSSQPAPVRIGEFRVNPPPPFEDEARSGQPPQKHQQQMQRFAAGRPSRIATTDDDEASREKKMEARLPPTTTQDKAKRIQQQRSLLEGTTRSTGGTPAIPSSTTTTTTTTTPKSRDATTPPPKSASPASRYLPSSSATEATAHGALLVVGSLLKHAGPFMMPRFREACDAAIALREHRSRAIRKAVTELLPRLAQYSPDAFSRAYLATTTQHLLKMARQRSNAWELRDASYEAIGRLALAVKHYLVPSLPELVLVICEHGLNVSPNVVPLHQRAGARSVVLDFASAPELRGVGSRGFGGAAAPDKPQHHDKSSPQPPGSAEDRRRRAVVIDCVADVVEALRDEMGPQHVDALLDALFAGGLSEPLIRALNVVSKSLPSRRPLVRARLLDELTSVLLPASGAPFAPPGWTRPASRRRLAPPPAADHLAGGGATAPRPPSGTHRQRASLFPAAAAAAVGQQQQPPPSPGALSLSGRAGAGAGVAAPPGYFLLEFDAVRVAPEREESVLLSLRALGEFSMEGVCLLPLVRDCVSRYLDCSTSSHIRAAAVVTCARLILPPKRLQLDAPTLSSRRESGGAAGRSRAKDGSRRLSLLKSLSLTEQRKGDGRRASRKSVVISGKTRLASFAEEGGGGKDEYRREYSDDEDDEDDDLDDDDDDDDEGAGLDDEDDETPDTDSSSIVTSSDATRLSATRRTLRDDVVGDDNDDVADAFHHGVDASVTSHPSDDSVPLRSNKKQSRRRSKSYRGGLTDASSRGTEDSGDSSQIYARRRARILADDTSSWGGGRRGRTATRGRRRLSSSVRDGLLLDESLRSHVDDVLPPWYFVGPSASVVDDVLRKLLRVALSDDDAIPRAAVLKALRADDRFDAHLCRAPHVDAISLLLHDEDTELQLAALALLGRLAAHNPAAVLGRVRDALARAVAALRCDASDAPAKERAARLAAAALRAESPKARRCVWYGHPWTDVFFDASFRDRPLAASVVASLPLGSRELGVRSATTKSMSAGTTISGSISGLGGLVAVARPAFSNSSIGRGPVHRRFHLEPQDDSHARLMQLGGSRLTSRAFGEDDGFRPSGARSMSRFVVANPSSVVPNRLVCASLDALAECVLVLGPRARSIVYTPRVLSPLFDALLDRSSSRKRELALKVLGRVASSAGCVVAPYLEHPPLLPRMLAVLRENYGGPSSLGTSSRGGMPWSLCREALRALGLVGALDPHKFELVQRGARDCRKHAARLAYEARDAAVARTREKAATVPVPMPTPAGANATSTSGGTQPIAIAQLRAKCDNQHAKAGGRQPERTPVACTVRRGAP